MCVCEYAFKMIYAIGGVFSFPWFKSILHSAGNTIYMYWVLHVNIYNYNYACICDCECNIFEYFIIYSCEDQDPRCIIFYFQSFFDKKYVGL